MTKTWSQKIRSNSDDETTENSNNKSSTNSYIRFTTKKISKKDKKKKNSILKKKLINAREENSRCHASFDEIDDINPVIEDQVKEFQEISSQTLANLNTIGLTNENKVFIKDFINKAKKKDFPKKEFIINGVAKKYTAYLNLTQSITMIKEKAKPIEFQCIFCNDKPFKAKLGETSNIKAHLSRVHDDLLGSWFNLYDNLKCSSNAFDIDTNTIKLVKYFISSNTSHSELENPYLRDLIPCKIPCTETFSETII